MATQVREIVRDALRGLNLIPADAEPEPPEAVKTLGLLNDMALAWPADNIHTGWSRVGLADDFPLEEKHEEGVKALLARKIASARGMAIAAGLEHAAQTGLNRLMADYKVLDTLRMDTGLQSMPSQRGGRWL